MTTDPLITIHRLPVIRDRAELLLDREKQGKLSLTDEDRVALQRIAASPSMDDVPFLQRLSKGIFLQD